MAVTKSEGGKDEKPLEGKKTNNHDKGGRKKKKKKRRGYNEPIRNIEAAPGTVQDVQDPKKNVEIEYVSEETDISEYDPTYGEFTKIFDKFKVETKAEEEEAAAGGAINADDEDSDNDDDEDNNENKVSKSKLRKLNRLTVAELKQLVDRPDVIEVHDVTAADPRLLVFLKATRNTVPVPKHWSQKRKYLQNKRGIEKPPFDLPDYIKKTGIMEMREALQEKEERMGLSGKLREKARPKMGKIDIDYQKLHDAFFRFQTKPKMSLHGDLYYEGKEFETKVLDRKPGVLSEDLRTALGMPVGDDARMNPIPPPWLLHMQRYGPPPSYPNLKIPGLNAPIPEGASFGWGLGQWGKPPVDEYGRPLYGDVFSTSNAELEAHDTEFHGSTELWGQLESESDESSEEEDSDEEGSDQEEEKEADESGTVTPSGYTSESPSGITSVQTGSETPDAIELRKRRVEEAMDEVEEPQTLYKVVPQKDTAITTGVMGSAHVYDMADAGVGTKKSKKAIGTGIEVAVNPEDLANMDQDALKEKYEQAEKEKNANKEDLSDMVAEHTSKAAKKRKQGSKKEDKASKKFKF
eukprot:m.334689 g.334689  ORF g.334689 m.334689 type:complete len:578 (+) comp17412_c0_seq1:119-1852(+)